jgi:cytochrome b561/polyisoprenoid-binding protein YceI
MAIANTTTGYGAVARGFHWLTALLILTAIPLGLIANAIPLDSDVAVAQKTLLFSIHKTVGVAVFFVALGRILWALTQPHPAPLHPDRKVETFLASTVHWTLYASLVLVPLSGWLHHAATTGFAPIWWPFGQSLPFVPVDYRVAEFFASWHWVFTKVLVAALILHVAGALKHAVVDRDSTLARMVSGRGEAVPSAPARSRAPVTAAVALWLAAIAAGSALGWPHAEAAGEDLAADAPAAAAAPWTIEEGTLSISVRQMNTDITGSFADWAATVDFDPQSGDPIKGSVEATIAVDSLTLGSVTAQAIGPDFLDAANNPLATFSAIITEHPNGDGYLAMGTLSLRGVEMPVELPFTFRPEGDLATVRAETTLDRRDFGIGQNLADESSLGFSVNVVIELTARRS